MCEDAIMVRARACTSELHQGTTAIWRPRHTFSRMLPRLTLRRRRTSMPMSDPPHSMGLFGLQAVGHTVLVDAIGPEGTGAIAGNTTQLFLRQEGRAFSGPFYLTVTVSEAFLLCPAPSSAVMV